MREIAAYDALETKQCHRHRTPEFLFKSHCSCARCSNYFKDGDTFYRCENGRYLRYCVNCYDTIML